VSYVANTLDIYALSNTLSHLEVVRHTRVLNGNVSDRVCSGPLEFSYESLSIPHLNDSAKSNQMSLLETNSQNSRMFREKLACL
jgi:hypothetical protein